MSYLVTKLESWLENGKIPIQMHGEPNMVEPFSINNLFRKAVPQFSTNYIIIGLNKVFNGLYLISVKFLGNKILGDKVVELGGKCSMGKSLFKCMGSQT